MSEEQRNQEQTFRVISKRRSRAGLIMNPKDKNLPEVEPVHNDRFKNSLNENENKMENLDNIDYKKMNDIGVYQTICDNLKMIEHLCNCYPDGTLHELRDYLINERIRQMRVIAPETKKD